MPNLGKLKVHTARELRMTSRWRAADTESIGISCRCLPRPALTAEEAAIAVVTLTRRAKMMMASSKPKLLVNFARDTSLKVVTTGSDKRDFNIVCGIEWQQVIVRDSLLVAAAVKAQAIPLRHGPRSSPPYDILRRLGERSEQLQQTELR